MFAVHGLFHILVYLTVPTSSFMMTVYGRSGPNCLVSPVLYVSNDMGQELV